MYSLNYNILIGRTGIATFDVVFSVAHCMMKFPTIGGITAIVPIEEALLIDFAEEC